MRGLAARLPALQGCELVVAGDLAADRYLFGTTLRISREAPVPVVRFDREELRPGCAANAAINAATLGARVRLVGVVGDDEPGAALLALLGRAGIDLAGVVVEAGAATLVKTRILAGGTSTGRQQLLRLDRERTAPPSAAVGAALERSLEGALEGAAALLLSGYGNGALGEGLLERAREGAARGVVVVGDARRDLGRLRGISALTPNEPELSAACGRQVEDEATALREGEALRRRLGCRLMLVTRGQQGMVLLGDGDPWSMAALGPVEVVDNTGAGDTVAAALTLGLGAGLEPREAATIANAAAGIVVTRRGASSATVQEVERALGQAGRP